MYYLQEGIPQNPEGYQESRLFLDSYVHKNCVVIQTITAYSWLDARLQLPG